MSYAFEDTIRMPIKMIFHYMRGRDDEHQEFKLLELRPVAGTYDIQQIPEQLTIITRIDSSKAVKQRVFSLGNTKINNKVMNAGRVDEIVKKGDLEIWTVKNDSVIYHPFHIHDVQFQILERDKKPPELNEMGWKDTVMIPPTKEVKLLVQFNDYSDASYPYMYHCHILEHEDMGMMGQFVVVDDLSQKITLPQPPMSMHMEH
jgi:bilirubin oxidase